MQVGCFVRLEFIQLDAVSVFSLPECLFPFNILKTCCDQNCIVCLDCSLNVIFLLFIHQEFEESGDPEKHYQALFTLAKEGIQKGKVLFLLS